MYKIYTPLLAILLFSCSSKIRYIGKSLPSTKKIEVFVSEQSIKQPYEYIGKGYIRGYLLFRNPNKIQEKQKSWALKKVQMLFLLPITISLIPAAPASVVFIKQTALPVA